MAASTSGLASSTSTTAADDTNDTDDGFWLNELDFGPPGEPGECRFGDTCPRGRKCVPRSVDEGPHYNVCAPVVRDPVPPGGACTLRPTEPDLPVDDCDAEHYCMLTDVEAQTGVCMRLCGIDQGLGAPPPDPTVCDRSEACHELGNILHVCFDRCDPLLQDCPAQWGCYVVQTDAVCVPTFGDQPSGEPCTYVNECQAGLACVWHELVPGCTTASECCTPHCDVTQPDECDAALPGSSCLPWWGERAPPRGLESLGVCGAAP